LQMLDTLLQVLARGPLRQPLDRLKRRAPLIDSDHQQSIKGLASFGRQPLEHAPASVPMRQRTHAPQNALQRRERRQFPAGSNQRGDDRSGGPPWTTS